MKTKQSSLFGAQEPDKKRADTFSTRSETVLPPPSTDRPPRSLLFQARASGIADAAKVCMGTLVDLRQVKGGAEVEYARKIVRDLRLKICEVESWAWDEVTMQSVCRHAFVWTWKDASRTDVSVYCSYCGTIAEAGGD